MKDWLRFSVAYWHTFDQRLVDPFGDGTAIRPYDKYTDPMDNAMAKVEASFEFYDKLGVDYFCFHDRDLAPEGDTLRETNRNLDKIVDRIVEYQKQLVRKCFGTRRTCSPTPVSLPEQLQRRSLIFTLTVQLKLSIV